MTKDDLAILINSLPGNETPPDYALKLLEDTCARTGLDWKQRHVYLMKRGGKWSVTLSIDGFRMIASNNDDYAGQEGPFWVTSSEGQWTDIPPEGAIYAAKVGVKHKSGNVTWGIAKFKDYSAGPMWAKFPSTMIAKCAEMLALRKAMPGKLGGLYGIEEMAQAGFKSKDEATHEATQEATRLSVQTTNLEEFVNRLDGATTLAELKRVGTDIMKSGLPDSAIQELHVKYNERKAKYGG